MLIGGHVSIAGGISKAVERASAQGFNVIQIFASSPRSYSVPTYSDEEITVFNSEFKEKKMEQLFFHAVYLLNLSSEKPSLVNVSIHSLIEYLRFGEQVGCTGTIFHIGSYKKLGFDAVKEQIAEAMKKVLDETPENQYLIMENSAGAPRCGSTIEELSYLYKAVSSPRLKICLDTQHLFASGIDVRSSTVFGEWLAAFDKEIGIEHVVCMHANDSKTELSSNHDKHENIGKGFIGTAGFKSILSQPLLSHKPWILEVPGIKGEGPDSENKEKLEGLLEKGLT